jgi:hypothetical protein
MEYHWPQPKSVDELRDELLPQFQALADQLMGRLDARLAPTVHLVAVPGGFQSPFEQVLWHASDGPHFIPPLDGARAFTMELLPDDTERPLAPNGPYASGTTVFHHHQARSFLTEKIRELDAGMPRTSVVSAFGQAESYHVAVVLRLDRTTYASYGGGNDHPPSLITEVANAFLQHVVQYFTDKARPDPTGIALPRIAEILRLAAARVTAGVLGATGLELSPEDLLTYVDSVAAITYERAENHGRILLGMPRGDDFFQLQRPVDLASTRAVRKLLEMSSERLALALEGRHAVGLVPLGDENVPPGSVTIDFRGRHRWELRTSEGVLMRVEATVADVPRPRMRHEDFDQAWIAAFDAPCAESELIWSIAEAAMEQRHGTLMIVSNEAAAEAQRLGRASTAIAPRVLTTQLVEAVTSVDGALLLDLEGRCHAVGVILDGLVSERGDPGRGARFNSALRYIDTRYAQGARGVAVVISEDGSVEVVAPMIAAAPLGQPLPA